MTARIAVVNEDFEPLSDIEVEAFDVATGDILELATTDTGGIAEFADVEFPLESIIFRPKNTRGTNAKTPREPKKPRLFGSDPNENTFGKASGTKSFGEINAEREAAEGGEGGEDTPTQAGMTYIQLLGPA